nr:glycosyltransferase family 4 protein [Anaerolineae bacterium]
MSKRKTAMLHYSAPPVVGGVEAVIQAHTEVFSQNGYPVSVVAGRGERGTLPADVDFILIPEMDSQHPEVVAISEVLEQGKVPPDFEAMANRLLERLSPVLADYDRAIVHNVFTKHFNLPLTVALDRMVDEGVIRNCIAWCHDFTWTSPSSRGKVHEGYPWDILRTYRQEITYAVVSRRRQEALAALLGCPADAIRVIYNGVSPATLLGLSGEGQQLVDRLGLLASDLIMLMPVRVTRAKNIEYALEVTAAIKAQGLDVKLVLSGPPDPHDSQSMAYYEHLRALRHRLGLDREMRFIFESGPDPDKPYTIDLPVVGDLLRVCDLVFMPSHREGFGMPVLEAGLIGRTVVSTAIPASEEIGGEDVILFDTGDPPESVSNKIIAWAGRNSEYRLRRRVRQRYTWEAIFKRDIEPLITGRASDA